MNLVAAFVSRKSLEGPRGSIEMESRLTTLTATEPSSTIITATIQEGTWTISGAPLAENVLTTPSWNGKTHNVSLQVGSVLFVDGTTFELTEPSPTIHSSGSGAQASTQASTTSPSLDQSLSLSSSPSDSQSTLSVMSATHSSASSTTAAKAIHHKSSLSTGATAGLAIGCVILGAAIAGFIVWLLMRKSRNKRLREGGIAAHGGHEKQPIMAALSKASSDSTLRTIENNLPLPLEDNAISGDMSKLSTLIKNHVQSYYHEASVPPGTTDLDALQALGNSVPISLGTLGTLLSNPATRHIGLRFCIAWVIVSRIKFDSDLTVTLLPPEIVHCMLSMTALDGRPQVRDAFLRNWRVITGELMQKSYLRTPFTSQDPRNHNIAETAEVLEAILSPYAVARIDQATRQRNLEEIIKRAATFAFVLFSQPSSWRLEWPDPRGMEQGSLVIFPALEQLSDEEGRKLSPPRVFTEMIVRQIDE